MSSPGPDPREVARLLRQRSEMGATGLFLDGMDRKEALGMASKLRTPAGRPGRGDAAGSASPGVAEGRPPRPAQERPSSGKAAGAPARAAGSLPVVAGSYEDLRAGAMACTRCRLSEGRTNVVFSDGVPDARVVVVGEAPGANEDATGLPFVGAAGQFLDLLLATVDLSRRDSVYICNVLKCRPPGNRNPLPDEIEACSPFLHRQLELVAPKVLLAVGSFAAQALTGDPRPLGRLRGEVHAYQGVPLVVTYHPAALLRNPGWTRSFWDDLQLLRTILDGA